MQEELQADNRHVILHENRHSFLRLQHNGSTSSNSRGRSIRKNLVCANASAVVVCFFQSRQCIIRLRSSICNTPPPTYLRGIIRWAPVLVSSFFSKWWRPRCLLWNYAHLQVAVNPTGQFAVPRSTSFH